ncbi:MAG TPA: hypothetical protein VFU73_11630 [Actinocrinis sp.]|nr:hypothetical protein [Actinocrinis sp.]
MSSDDLRAVPDAYVADDVIDLDLDLDLGGDDGAQPGAVSPRRIRARHLALAAAVLAAGAGAFGGDHQHRLHDQALAARTDALSAVVSRAAGSGVDSVFDFGYRGTSSTLTLSGSTIIYAVCESGQLAIGARRWACDGKAIRLGPFGKAGDTVRVTLPGSPWGIIVRPTNVFYLSPPFNGHG